MQWRPNKLNGAIHVTCTILKLVAASASEVELGALFLNAQEAKVIRLVLAKLGHPQLPTPIHIIVNLYVLLKSGSSTGNNGGRNGVH